MAGITEMIFNLNELDNTDNLEDGRPSNILLHYHVTDDKDFTRFKPNIPKYKKLKWRVCFFDPENNESKE